MSTESNMHRSRIVALVTLLVIIAGLSMVSHAFAFETRKPVGGAFGTFTSPQDVAVDQSTGNVYASDSAPNLIDVFGPEGGLPLGGVPSQLTGGGTPAGAFGFAIYPVGIAVDASCSLRGLVGTACAAADPSNGAIYVSDRGHGVVDKFRVNGSHEFEYVCQFAGHGGMVGTSCLLEGGTPTTRFNEQWGLAVDTEGDLYVSDWGSAAIYEFNSEGEEIASFSSPSLENPEFVAVDANGTVYGQSYWTGNVVEFKRGSPTGPVEGEPTLIAHGHGGLAVDSTTHRLLVETGSSVDEFDPEGKLLAAFGEGACQASGGFAFDQASENVYVVCANGGASAQIQTFGPRLTIPNVSTGGTSGLAAKSVVLEGVVDPLGISATYFFEYGETEAYGSRTLSASAGEADADTPVSTPVSGLTPNTSYHYKLVTENENGVHRGTDKVFKTPSIQPALGAESSSDPTRAGVLLHGVINPEASDTTYHFVYVEEDLYEPSTENPYIDGGSTHPAAAGAGFAEVPVEQLISGLKANTTYHYTLVAINQAGVSVGSDRTFTTGFLTPPFAVTGAGDALSPNDATIAGTLNTRGLATTYGFEVGTTTDYGPPTGRGAIGAGANEANVLLELTGLQPGVTYHFRLTATNIDGTTYGEDRTFTTGVFANVLVTPPAPLPFVSVPTIVFPADAKAPVVKKKTVTKKGKLKKKRAKKSKPKKKLKNKKR